MVRPEDVHVAVHLLQSCTHTHAHKLHYQLIETVRYTCPTASQANGACGRLTLAGRCGVDFRDDCSGALAAWNGVP